MSYNFNINTILIDSGKMLVAKTFVRELLRFAQAAYTHAHTFICPFIHSCIHELGRTHKGYTGLEQSI